MHFALLMHTPQGMMQKNQPTGIGNRGNIKRFAGLFTIDYVLLAIVFQLVSLAHVTATRRIH